MSSTLASDRQHRLRRVVSFLILSAVSATTAVDAQQRLRSSTTVVPIDVRVVDRNGRPVTDLKAGDFTLLEDGVPQRIDHFLVTRLGTSGEPLASDAPPASGALEAPQRRVFLIVLGSGRHTGPVKDLEAITDFVGRRLLPSDQVAHAAYNKATRFTTNRAETLKVIERYRRLHLRIEALLAQRRSGLGPIYRPGDMPPAIQSLIDEIFGLDASTLSDTAAPRPAADDAERRRTADDLQRASILASREGGLPDLMADLTAAALGVSFDEYVAQTAATLGDVSNLYKGIAYLRHVDGEKHLLFSTPVGLFLPRSRQQEDLAAAASDARVVVNIIHSGGVVGAPPPTSRRTEAMPTAAQVFNQTFNIKGLREFAELTGGQVWAFQHGSEAIDRLDEMSRVQYVLGYTPSNPGQDVRFRKIVVTVNRPDVKLLYRHGYFGGPAPEQRDRDGFLSYVRIASAGAHAVPLREIDVRVDAQVAPDVAASGRVFADVRIGATSLSFSRSQDRRLSVLDVAVFVGESNEAVVGESWQVLELKLSDATFQQMLLDGVRVRAEIPFTGRPRYVKVVVYERASDRVGSAVIELRPARR